jgi:hypothetical protein
MNYFVRLLSLASLSCCIFLTACISHTYLYTHSRLHPYAGEWLLKYSGKNMMLLTLKAKRGKLTGTLTQPEHFSENWNGNFTGITLPIIAVPAVGIWNGNHAELTTGPKTNQDRSTMTLTDEDHLLIAFFHGMVPDWRFERISSEKQTAVDRNWPAYVSDPEIVSIRHQLRSMAEADKQARERKIIDQNEINRLSDESRPFLDQIYSVYGWPKISIFGAPATEDYWLLVQHQPLAFQEQMLPAMKSAVDTGEAANRDYAYLFDRLQVEHGKPQHWGTQSHCEHKRAVLYDVDDPKRLEQYRKEAGLEALVEALRAASSMCERLPE